MTDANTSRVLVVDDEPHLREMLADALSDGGIEVAVAASGSEAVRMAQMSRPDLLVTDLRLGDCTGLDVIDTLRAIDRDLPAVVITGHGDAQSLTEASRRRPVEVFNKPLDINRLRLTVRSELDRKARLARLSRRNSRLRLLARRSKLRSRQLRKRLDTTFRDLTVAYRTLRRQAAMQQVLLNYQQQLIDARDDDDVFRAMFNLFVQQSAPVFGLAMACDANAELQMAGRFGVPRPDSPEFCRRLAGPVINALLANPRGMLMDAQESIDLFDPSIRRYLVGVTILAMPLMPAEGELIGLVILYRKGEQPFTNRDVALADMLSGPTALAVRRND